MLVRAVVAIILIDIIFIIFSKTLYKQMQNKQESIEASIAQEKQEIANIDKDKNSIHSKISTYQQKTAELKSINEKISKVAEAKNSIPNLLNQIMYVIPEEVRLTSIENTIDKKIRIIAEAEDYDQLGYFIAKIKLEGYLKNVVSSSGQKSGDVVKVTIEGDLPWGKFWLV